MADGFSLNLDGGLELQARKVLDKTWLGVMVHGKTFLALAEFISGAEADYLTRLLKSRAIVIAALDEETP